VQFVINIFVDEFHAGILAGQQEDIVSESKRHFLAIASFSIAGNQLRAWESPKRTIEVFEARFP
jgi:hypothetical protein